MRWPRSPRTRRRLAWLGGIALAAASAAAVIVLLPGAQRPAEVFRDVPPDIPEATPRSVPTSVALRQRLAEQTAAFVRTAVRREHLEQSWPMVHPHLRQGLTRRQWLSGAIPVVPFPAIGIAEWRVDWSYADDIAADVVLVPAKRSGLYRKSFTIEFRRVGPAGEGRWLVYSWVPNGVSEALIQAREAPAVQAALEDVRGHRGLPAWWVLVPIVGFVAVFLLPVVLVVNERRRLRRAEEAHRQAVARYSSSSRPS